ncbi:TonB-dependent receptor [Prolixibacter bellariivorans]|uniref:TonB-dependent receptor n=1 Tax=Prolixibacter bellariivorans TaxID=314319 RepID=UPI0004724F95|nr:TonB-dependent receptor [Prolixibacter bellariivorans]
MYPSSLNKLPALDRIQKINRFYSAGRRIHYSVIACLLLLVGVVGQVSGKPVRVVLSGTITDAQTGETLVGASVFETVHQQGTITDPYGHFSLQTNPGEQELVVSFIGYETFRRTFDLKKDTVLSVALKPKVFTTGDVKVVGSGSLWNINSTQGSANTLTPRDIDQIPTLLGEKDVMKAIQMLPGVQGGTEGSSDLIVRGGGPGQNLVLIDGIPVFNASHLFGFYSVFIPEAVKNIDFYKGAFPARYGGHLSSVVDVTMKEGNMKKITGSVSVGTLSSKGLIEGPIKKDKGSFLLAARRTYFDVFLSPLYRSQFSAGENGTLGYHFYDMVGKASYRLSPSDKLYASMYKGRDILKSTYGESYDNNTSNSSVGINWGNITSALRWNHIHSGNMTTNVQATYARFDYRNLYTSDERNGTDSTQAVNRASFVLFSGVKQAALRSQTDWVLSPAHRLIFGAEGNMAWFEPGSSTTRQSQANNEQPPIIDGGDKIRTSGASLFGEWHWKMTDRFTLNTGLRASYFHVGNKSFYFVQPRLSARYLLNETSSLKLSYARMYQPVHLLSSGNGNFPAQVWVPATSAIKPETSHQVSAGYYTRLHHDFNFSAEAYYKQLGNQVRFSDEVNLSNTLTDWQTNYREGKGRAWGLELLLRKKRGKTTGWIGYTLAWNQRQYNGINNNRWFWYQYDRRHDLKLNVAHHFSKQVQLAANWVYSSGYPFNAPLMSYNGYPGFINYQVYDFLTGNENKTPGYINIAPGYNSVRMELITASTFRSASRAKNGWEHPPGRLACIMPITG